jgi:hypothetical protein
MFKAIDIVKGKCIEYEKENKQIRVEHRTNLLQKDREHLSELEVVLNKAQNSKQTLEKEILDSKLTSSSLSYNLEIQKILTETQNELLERKLNELTIELEYERKLRFEAESKFFHLESNNKNLNIEVKKLFKTTIEQENWIQDKDIKIKSLEINAQSLKDKYIYQHERSVRQLEDLDEMTHKLSCEMSTKIKLEDRLSELLTKVANDLEITNKYINASEKYSEKIKSLIRTLDFSTKCVSSMTMFVDSVNKWLVKNSNDIEKRNVNYEVEININENNDINEKSNNVYLKGQYKLNKPTIMEELDIILNNADSCIKNSQLISGMCYNLPNQNDFIKLQNNIISKVEILINSENLLWIEQDLLKSSKMKTESNNVISNYWLNLICKKENKCLELSNTINSLKSTLNEKDDIITILESKAEDLIKSTNEINNLNIIIYDLELLNKNDKDEYKKIIWELQNTIIISRCNYDDEKKKLDIFIDKNEKENALLLESIEKNLRINTEQNYCILGINKIFPLFYDFFTTINEEMNESLTDESSNSLNQELSQININEEEQKISKQEILNKLIRKKELNLIAFNEFKKSLNSNDNNFGKSLNEKFKLPINTAIDKCFIINDLVKFANVWRTECNDSINKRLSLEIEMQELKRYVRKEMRRISMQNTATAVLGGVNFKSKTSLTSKSSINKSSKIKNNDIENNDIKNNDIKNNDIENNDIKNNDIKNNDNNREIDNIIYEDNIDDDVLQSKLLRLEKVNIQLQFRCHESITNMKEVQQSCNEYKSDNLLLKTLNENLNLDIKTLTGQLSSKQHQLESFKRQTIIQKAVSNAYSKQIDSINSQSPVPPDDSESNKAKVRRISLSSEINIDQIETKIEEIEEEDNSVEKAEKLLNEASEKYKHAMEHFRNVTKVTNTTSITKIIQEEEINVKKAEETTDNKSEEKNETEEDDANEENKSNSNILPSEEDNIKSEEKRKFNMTQNNITGTIKGNLPWHTRRTTFLATRGPLPDISPLQLNNNNDNNNIILNPVAPDNNPRPPKGISHIEPSPRVKTILTNIIT